MAKLAYLTCMQWVPNTIAIQPIFYVIAHVYIFLSLRCLISDLPFDHLLGAWDHIFKRRGVPQKTALGRHLAPPKVQGFYLSHPCSHGKIVDPSRYCLEVALPAGSQGMAFNSFFGQKMFQSEKNSEWFQLVPSWPNVHPSCIRRWHASFWCCFGPQTSQLWVRHGEPMVQFHFGFRHVVEGLFETKHVIILYAIGCVSPKKESMLFWTKHITCVPYVFSGQVLFVGWIYALTRKLFPKFEIKSKGSILIWRNFSNFVSLYTGHFSSSIALLQSYEFVELWAGAGMASGMVQRSGRTIAALDIAYFQKDPNKPGRSNYFDILTPSGFGHHCCAK